MKNCIWLFLIIVFCQACNTGQKENSNQEQNESLSQDVINETLKTWKAYVRYAWPHDNLLPLSKGHRDWYDESISISPIDAYSTLKIMGFEEEAQRIEKYVTDTLNFDKDLDVKVFEVNIRIMGGLLCMYEWSGKEQILAKAKDFGNRLLPTFNSPTGIPYYSVNLKTGETKGEVVNVAEAGTYILEFGLLSYYTEDPAYYQAAKKAVSKIHSLRSDIGLIGTNINVETGEWTYEDSSVGCCVDSYFEYLYKAWLLFGDPELKEIWDTSIDAIQEQIAESDGDRIWYGHVDMNSGEKTSARVTLWDAYFPALLALSGDLERANKAQNSWDYLWNKHGLIPVAYNYDLDSVIDPYYQLNPEVIESAYYLWHFTGDSLYYKMVEKYYADVKAFCRTDIAYAHVKDITTKEQDDQMATFFIAETMKYFFLTFDQNTPVNPTDYVFTTEAHPFNKNNIDKEKAMVLLGISK